MTATTKDRLGPQEATGSIYNQMTKDELDTLLDFKLHGEYPFDDRIESNINITNEAYNFIVYFYHHVLKHLDLSKSKTSIKEIFKKYYQNYKKFTEGTYYYQDYNLDYQIDFFLEFDYFGIQLLDELSDKKFQFDNLEYITTSENDIKNVSRKVFPIVNRSYEAELSYLLSKKPTEFELEQLFCKRCNLEGYDCLKCDPYKNKGIPDRLVVTPYNQYFVEIKSPSLNWRLSKAQFDCISDLRLQGYEVFILDNIPEIEDIINDIKRLDSEKRSNGSN